VTRHIATPVLVVGGGPVGTTLAMDLAWRGIEVLVAEQRHRGELPSVKCNHVAARTMEIFRRLGVAQRIRDAGLPPDHTNDVAFRTTTTGIEFARIPIPCRRDRYTMKDGPDGWWPTPEPPHRINQIYLEPLLVDCAAAMPGLRYLNRVKVLGITQTADAVTAEARDLDTDETLLITADYLIGCDGPSSEIRRQIGARLTGDALISRTQSTYIRAPSLTKMMQAAPAWSTQSLNPRRSANMFAVDGRETWLIHNYLRHDETDFATVDRDRCIRLILGVGPAFEYETLGQEDWIGRRMLADRFPRSPRVHLRRCGTYLGAVRRLRHECRHRGCDGPVVDGGGCAARMGGARDPRCVRGRALAYHRAGVALRDEHGIGVDAGASGGAGEHRGPGAGR
jgi:2-polyprenyl-6-methoxyphenol hydroxylase-like FAD-dependent oxidoreductase